MSVGYYNDISNPSILYYQHTLQVTETRFENEWHPQLFCLRSFREVFPEQNDRFSDTVYHHHLSLPIYIDNTWQYTARDQQHSNSEAEEPWIERARRFVRSSPTPLLPIIDYHPTKATKTSSQKVKSFSKKRPKSKKQKRVPFPQSSLIPSTPNPGQPTHKRNPTKIESIYQLQYHTKRANKNSISAPSSHYLHQKTRSDFSFWNSKKYFHMNSNHSCYTITNPIPFFKRSRKRPALRSEKTIEFSCNKQTAFLSPKPLPALLPEAPTPILNYPKTERRLSTTSFTILSKAPLPILKTQTGLHRNLYTCQTVDQLTCNVSPLYLDSFKKASPVVSQANPKKSLKNTPKIQRFCDEKQTGINRDARNFSIDRYGKTSEAKINYQDHITNFKVSMVKLPEDLMPQSCDDNDSGWRYKYQISVLKHRDQSNTLRNNTENSGSKTPYSMVIPRENRLAPHTENETKSFIGDSSNVRSRQSPNSQSSITWKNDSEIFIDHSLDSNKEAKKESLSVPFPIQIDHHKLPKENKVTKLIIKANGGCLRRLTKLRFVRLIFYRRRAVGKKPHFRII